MYVTQIGHLAKTKILKVEVFKLRLGSSGGYPVGLLVCLPHELLDKVASIGLEVIVLGDVGGCISKKVMLV